MIGKSKIIGKWLYVLLEASTLFPLKNKNKITQIFKCAVKGIFYNFFLSNLHERYWEKCTYFFGINIFFAKFGSCIDTKCGGGIEIPKCLNTSK